MKLIKGLLLFLVVSSVLVIAGGFLLINVYLANDYENESERTTEETDMSVEQFIDEISETARELAEKNDLYASVMIAQAILESDRGRSGLATEPYYNLFGVKGRYQNQAVELETYEDDGNGNLTMVMAEFRQYPSYEASLQDYVDLLRGGVSWDSKFYEATFKSNTTSYEEVTAFLTGTYATDSRYAEKLNSLIRQYDLVRYDVPVAD